MTLTIMKCFKCPTYLRSFQICMTPYRPAVISESLNFPYLSYTFRFDFKNFHKATITSKQENSQGLVNSISNGKKSLVKKNKDKKGANFTRAPPPNQIINRGLSAYSTYYFC